MKKKLGYLFVVIIAILLIVLPFFIKVKTMCVSQYGSCPDELNLLLKKADYSNLYLSKSKVSNILKKDLLVQSYSIQFKLPNILLINTIIKKPVYSILDKQTGKYYLVDESGEIITISESSNFPNLALDGFSLNVGQKIPNDYLYALKTIQGVYIMYQVSKGFIENDSLVVDMPAGIRVIFPVRDMDIDVLLGSFRLIYTKVTTDYLGTYSQIDMRYKNPILR